MKKFIVILFVFVAGNLFGQLGFGYDPSLISEKTQKIINDIESSGHYEEVSLLEIHFPFRNLTRIASKAELIELTNHPNPIIRHLAFRALVIKSVKKGKLLEIAKRHLKDTSIVEIWHTRTTIGDNMLSTLLESEKYGLSKKERAEIDSLLFWNDQNLIWERISVFERCAKTPRNYARLKEIVKQKNPYALMPLLSYGNLEDQEFIKEIFPVSPSHALLALKTYPMYDLVPKIKEFQFSDPFNYSNATWCTLYGVALKYDKKTALEIFLNVYKNNASLAIRYRQAEFIYRTIRNDTSSYLAPVKLEIAWYIGDMDLDFLNYVWEKDSIRIHKMIIKKITEESNRYLAESTFHIFTDKLEQTHKDSTVHIINTGIQNASPGHLIIWLALRAKKYNNPKTISILSSRFNSFGEEGGFDIDNEDIGDFAKAILAFNNSIVFKQVEAKSFEILKKTEFGSFYGKPLVELVLKCNKQQAVKALLLILDKNQKDTYFRRNSLSLLLKLNEENINRKLLNLYRLKPERFKNSPFGKSYRRELENNGLL